MPNGPDPALLRRRVMSALRLLRSAQGVTQTQVAQALDWSQSKVDRIENGVIGISPKDLRALLGYYGQSGPDADELLAMTLGARRQPFAAFAEVLSPDFKRFLGYEGAASVVRNFEALVVPGLLQTPEYAEAIVRMYNPHEPADRRAKRVRARAVRQLLLTREERPELHFILGEAVLDTDVGAESGRPGLMRAQLDHLVELSDRPGIRLQVVRKGTGAHLGLAGAFVLLEFADAPDERILYLESRIGETIRDTPELTAGHLEAFAAIERQATPADAFADVVAEIRASLAPGVEADPRR